VSFFQKNRLDDSRGELVTWIDHKLFIALTAQFIAQRFKVWQCEGGYLVVFNVTDFEIGLPFFGVTFTVTLQEPALSAFSFVPDTVQYFAETDETLTDNCDVEDTARLR